MLIEENNAPATYIKTSLISGQGLFAKKKFQPNEIIIDYRPFIKSFYRLEWNQLTPEQYNKNWLVPIDEQYCLTNDKACKFHFLNHSRTPNCNWLINDLIITANQNIKKDDELFIDYRLEYRPNRKEFPTWV